MKRFTICFLPLVALASLALGSTACHSNPFCLNCGNGGEGDGGGSGKNDLASNDLAGSKPDLAGQMPDLTGPCVQSNNGVEKCDGLDNDCDGVVDNVVPDKLASDPNNCGKCGNVCDFIGQKQFGECGMGAGGVPECKPAGCLPGFVDIDPNVPGCEYACTPTTPATEVCDGVDNDCDGTIDNGFRDASGKYTVDVNHCGGCNMKCTLPGAVNKCLPGGSGNGQCVVDHCVNDGTSTFRHDPAAGDRDVVGCEYKCPTASTTVTSGSDDCDSVSCDFPAETCDNADNNCNFMKDEGLGDLGPCAQNCPGGNLANCVGQCAAGTSMCVGGVTVCMGSTGPSAEVCDGVDNDCNGKKDDPFVDAGGKYTVSALNCGGCGMACNLANANNACHDKGGGVAECFVQSCKSGFAFPTNTTCGAPGTPAPGVMVGSRDGAGGLGCYYSCPAKTREFCDGKDNDCDGCIDNNNSSGAALDGQPAAGSFCKNAGQCATAIGAGALPVVCSNRGTSNAAWKCDYVAARDTYQLCLDASGNPTTVESGCVGGTKTAWCDAKDNNCNGRVDDGLGLYQECTSGASCSNGRTTCAGSGTQSTCNNGFWCDSGFCKVACAKGVGPCRVTAAVQCQGDPAAAVACSISQGNPFKARDEICDGIDNDCDGTIDERTTGPANGCYTSDAGAGQHNCAGFQDSMLQVQAKACGCTPSSGNCPTGYTCGKVVDASGAQIAGNFCVETSPRYQTCTASNQCTGSTTSNRCDALSQGLGNACDCDPANLAARGCPAGYVCGQPAGQTQSYCYQANDSPQACSAGGQCTSGNCSNLGSAFYIYSYEASRTTATNLVGGADEADPTLRRSCSVGNKMPWTSVNPVDAATACSKVKDSTGASMRLCAEFEWQAACIGSTWTANPQWSEATTPATWNALCNAENPAGAVAVTGAGASQCYTDWAAAGKAYDMTGNVMEWTSTTVTSGATTYYRQRGGAFNSPRDGSSCQFSFNLGKPDFLNSDVGFRCCSANAP